MKEDRLPRPLKEFRSGLVYASIWRLARQGLDGREEATYIVRITRRYRTDQGELAESPYLAHDELPQLAAVAQAAYTWLTVEERPVSDGSDRPIVRRPLEPYAAEPAS